MGLAAVSNGVRTANPRDQSARGNKEMVIGLGRKNKETKKKREQRAIDKRHK